METGTKAIIGIAIFLAVRGLVRAWFVYLSEPEYYTSFRLLELPMPLLVQLTALGVGYYLYKFIQHKTKGAWLCDYCNGRFKTSEECAKHEKNCPKRKK